MHTERLAVVFLLAVISMLFPVRAGCEVGTLLVQDEDRLHWSSPCRITHKDGSPYCHTEIAGQKLCQVEQSECDYMRASIEADQGVARYFNRLPTLAAQKDFFHDALARADLACLEYSSDRDKLLEDSDPASLPTNLGPRERLRKLMKMLDDLKEKSLEVSQPFLWAEQEPASYLKKDSGKQPASWRPYLQPFDQREHELSRLIQQAHSRVIHTAKDNIEQSLAFLQSLGLEDAQQAAPQVREGTLRRLFDHSDSSDNTFIVRISKKDSAARVIVAPWLLRPLLGGVPSPQASPAIPVTVQEGRQRNYFARGFDAGLDRLRNDAAIALGHFLGQSRTIGDPYGKASLVVQQKSCSCAIVSSYQALRARHRQVKVEDVVRRAFKQGNYAEYNLEGSECAGGAWLEQASALLGSYGVPAHVLQGSATAQLDLTIRTSARHDALVTVTNKIYSGDSDIPTHAVYVTGEEVSADGRALGYYINDTNYAEGARFIPVELCAQACKKVVALDKLGVRP